MPVRTGWRHFLRFLSKAADNDPIYNPGAINTSNTTGISSNFGVGGSSNSNSSGGGGVSFWPAARNYTGARVPMVMTPVAQQGFLDWVRDNRPSNTETAISHLGRINKILVSLVAPSAQLGSVNFPPVKQLQPSELVQLVLEKDSTVRQGLDVSTQSTRTAWKFFLKYLETTIEGDDGDESGEHYRDDAAVCNDAAALAVHQMEEQMEKQLFGAPDRNGSDQGLLLMMEEGEADEEDEDEEDDDIYSGGSASSSDGSGTAFMPSNMVRGPRKPTPRVMSRKSNGVFLMACGTLTYLFFLFVLSNSAV